MGRARAKGPRNLTVQGASLSATCSDPHPSVTHMLAAMYKEYLHPCHADSSLILCNMPLRKEESRCSARFGEFLQVKGLVAA